MLRKPISRTIISLAVFVFLLIASAIGVSIAQSHPSRWSKHASNPVFDVGEPSSWDDKMVFDPAVLFDGSLYRMWYTGNRGSNLSYVGYATSPDGLSWTRHVTNPVLNVGTAGDWDETSVRYACVISDTNTFKMWYTGRDASEQSRIGYATSLDGAAWTKYNDNPVIDLGLSGSWDDIFVGEPTVIREGSTYKMWYRGGSSDGGRGGIGYATSSDGIHWTKYGGNPVISDAPGGNWDYWAYAPHVVFDGSVYHMWYSGGNYGGTAWEVGYATSTDGINWTKHGRVLQQGPDGSFDRYSADHPAVLLISDTFKMWYSGWDANNYGRIGYASAPALNLTHTVYLPLVLRNSGICSPVWSDDFSDYRSGWFIADDTWKMFAYISGEYQIVVKNPDQYNWSSPGVQMSNGMIVTDMRFGAVGDDGDNGGILFGQMLDNDEKFYRFVVQRNGSYCIQRHTVSPWGWDNLSCGTATGYLPYPATNQLKIIRNGAAITALLNDQTLTTVFDDNYIGSLRVGLSAGSAGGGADVRFDNYGVYPLECTDTTSPTVTSTYPSDGATGVNRDLAAVSITFNEPMNPNRWSLLLGGLGDVEGSYEPSSYTFTFTRTSTDPLPPNTSFTLTINPEGYDPGFVDLSGNPAPLSTFSFTTGN